MNNKDNKLVDEQEKLLDHLIEYGGRQYINDEIKKYEELPELEPSKEFDDRMNRMFKDAYKQEVRRENVRFGKKIAVIAVATVGVVSAAAMNIKAVREPVLNFVFKQNGTTNKAQLNKKKASTPTFSFNYIPKDYKLAKKTYGGKNNQTTYEYKSKIDNDFIYIRIQSNQKYDNYLNQSSSNKYEELHYKNHTYYFLNGNSNTLMGYKNNCIISIISTKEQSELLKIFSSIKTKK